MRQRDHALAQIHSSNEAGEKEAQAASARPAAQAMSKPRIGLTWIPTQRLTSAGILTIGNKIAHQIRTPSPLAKPVATRMMVSSVSDLELRDALLLRAFDVSGIRYLSDRRGLHRL